MNISRRLPRLIWVGDEVDVCITFLEDPLQHNVSPDSALAGLDSGGLAEIESQLRHMGITFDRSQGFGGRDWEWDWSLKGPVRVKFRSKAREPQERKTIQQPALKIVS